MMQVAFGGVYACRVNHDSSGEDRASVWRSLWSGNPKGPKRDRSPDSGSSVTVQLRGSRSTAALHHGLQSCQRSRIID
jgi:hypothetical protein